ncbi:MAG: bifunctional [glutamine synthetase] adenylyltransferase/[glutamine synthetase]-adenylyl-L-tyrosine phosphorylase [Actinomycetaceae bacterium]|nr:bifunctional [glutamine synthetase] adenylyltransferase/[glutamine synthetase]-adenylyl-L-tyrosine phosphorylase [Actinomycetaceae bacterium]
MARIHGIANELRKAGVHQVRRAQPWFDYGGPLEWLSHRSDFFTALRYCADPDMALLTLVRLGETLQDSQASNLLNQCRHWEHLLAVMGASQTLGEYLVTHPHLIASVCDSSDTQAWVTPLDGPSHTFPLLYDEYRSDEERQAVDQWSTTLPSFDKITTSDELRQCYRSVLMQIARDDLASPQPCGLVSVIGRKLSALADATLRAALRMARTMCDPDSTVKFAIIAMGKTGAQELNYISDIDVMYVVEPRGSTTEEDAVKKGSLIAVELQRLCSQPGVEAPLWPIDTALRPEGKDGALVRTLQSYHTYYSQWAKSWEFQALLKARYVGGDRELGKKFIDTISEFVWNAGSRDDFVDDARHMRVRVEENIPRRHRQRQLKLGPGGLRDVEFSVQLLQLVHGRLDSSLRVANTFEAIDSLVQGGYISRDTGRYLSGYYRFLRLCEHRVQLYRMKRTHMIPHRDDDLRRLARCLHIPGVGDAAEFLQLWDDVRQKVRSLHSDLFYRPLLPATAQLSPLDVSLTPQAQQARLTFIGYRDPLRAIEHISALSEGMSRRAQIQRHLLPVLLGWFADGPSPDEGLLSFRRLSEAVGSEHWYMALLRDSRVVARRLADLLSTSRYVADALEHLPHSVRWLDDDEALNPRTPEQLNAEIDAIISRHDNDTDAISRLVAIRRREMVRTACGDVLDQVDPSRSATMITPLNDAIMRGMLAVAMRQTDADQLGVTSQQCRIAIIGMGRYGGEECSYSSDADIMVAYEALDPTDEQAVAKYAIQCAKRLGEYASQAHDPTFRLAIDMDLRPEGRQGALARSLEGYRSYYDTWMSPWERQALLRARFVCGDAVLGQSMMTMIDAIRYGGNLSQREIREIRRLKARMEKERLPRGADPAWHVKLGTGGLSDVEWCIQFLQLKYSSTYEQLRTASTLTALSQLHNAGYIGSDDADTLRQSWLLCSRIRAGNVLASGRVHGKKLDMLPRSPGDLRPLAQLLGYKYDQIHELEEHYRRATRRARSVMEKLFYDD